MGETFCTSVRTSISHPLASKLHPPAYSTGHHSLWSPPSSLMPSQLPLRLSKLPPNPSQLSRPSQLPLKPSIGPPSFVCGPLKSFGSPLNADAPPPHPSPSPTNSRIELGGLLGRWVNWVPYGFGRRFPLVGNVEQR